MHLDTVHPVYGAHHQKIVCIDDAVAFVGGIDLTVERWDSCDHTPDDPLRICDDGTCYPAVHDVQMIVDGDAARAVADLARDRWLTGVGEELEPVASEGDPWPPELEPDFTDISVGIARTSPRWNGFRGVDEITALTADTLRAARHSIYIEAQYFAAPMIGDILAAGLARPEGPEIIVVTTQKSRGILEQWAMGHNRDRLIRRLLRADKFGRFRVTYPAVPSEHGDCPVMVHSKVVIVDDMILRVGSANLNNRSLGLDTECDLVIEGTSPSTRRTITEIRTRLLAEHLGATPEHAAEVFASEASIIAAFDRLNASERGLRPFKGVTLHGPTKPVIGTFLLDPRRPFGPPWFHRWLRPPSVRRST
jgi:phosphatidylserine/phosphatidylglycerophosphate/cardiolipin synthase-like enzyme